MRLSEVLGALGMLDCVTSPATRRRPSRLGRILLITAIVLVGLLVAADRIAVAVAERTAADTLQRSQQLKDRPDVSIGGFPFLTQLATGDFDRITATVHDLTVGQDSGTPLQIDTLHVVLRHVHVARDFNSARSEFSTATAVVSYASLTDALKTPFTYAGAGRIKATDTADVIPGLSVPASATARVSIQGESLTFTDTQVSVAGQQLPASVTDYFANLFGRTIPLTGLPFAVHVKSVRATGQGVQITLTAAGLTYHR